MPTSILIWRACLAGECYDPLRPAGIQYWFSLPLRFELPLEYLIAANWVLLLISILLASIAIATNEFQGRAWHNPANAACAGGRPAVLFLAIYVGVTRRCTGGLDGNDWPLGIAYRRWDARRYGYYWPVQGWE